MDDGLIEQTTEQRITGVIQDCLDAQSGRGHIVTEWVLVLRAIEPDGSVTSTCLLPDDQDRIMSLGLASIAEDEVRSIYDEDDE